MSLQGSEMLEGSRFLDQEEFHAKKVVSLSILMLYLPLHVYYFFSCVNLDPCDCNIVYHLRYINQSTQPGRARCLHGGEAREGGREEEQPGGWLAHRRGLRWPPGVPPHWSGAGAEERWRSRQPQQQAGRQQRGSSLISLAAALRTSSHRVGN